MINVLEVRGCNLNSKCLAYSDLYCHGSQSSNGRTYNDFSVRSICRKKMLLEMLAWEVIFS